MTYYVINMNLGKFIIKFITMSGLGKLASSAKKTAGIIWLAGALSLSTNAVADDTREQVGDLVWNMRADVTQVASTQQGDLRCEIERIRFSCDEVTEDIHNDPEVISFLREGSIEVVRKLNSWELGIAHWVYWRRFILDTKNKWILSPDFSNTEYATRIADTVPQTLYAFPNLKDKYALLRSAWNIIINRNIEERQKFIDEFLVSSR